MPKEKTFVSLVCYLNNCEGEIESFVASARKTLSEKFEFSEIILVDDASRDATFKSATAIMNSLKVTGSVIKLSKFHGRELALFAGLDKAIGDWIFECQAPAFAHDLNMLETLFDKAKTGTDIVSLVPDAKPNFATRLFYALFNRFAPFEVAVAPETIVLMSRRALNAILTISERVRYKKALLALTGFPDCKIIYHSDRLPIDDRGFLAKAEVAMERFVSYTPLGTSLAVGISALFMAISLLVSSYAIVSYLFNKEIAYGWTSLMLFLSFGFSAMFFVLGLLSQHLGKIVREVVNLPIYNVDKSVSFFETTPSENDSTTRS